MKKISKFYFIVVLFVMSFIGLVSLDVQKVEAASYDSYYTSVDTSSGQQLMSSLTKIVSNGYKSLGYSNRLSAYPTTDIRPGTNYIWDMYSNENYTINDDGASATAEGQGYNTEHSVPQSWFDKSEPMRSDLFHIYPTDIRVNSIRSNYPYGETDNPTTTTKNGSKLGSSSIKGYSGKVFEPIDEYKGDFARTYFYMATRYSSSLNGWTSDAKKVFSGSYPYLTNYAIDLFTRWHELDPVSEKEISRNEAIYKIQNNRNPYIDHPEYANVIWGDGEIEEPTPSKFTVTYSCGQDVSFSYTDNKEYTSGSLISKPNVNPTKVGFEFVGWTNDTITRDLWDFEIDKITKNITLYPIFKVNSIDAFTGNVSKVTTQLLANYIEVESDTTSRSVGYKLVTSLSDLAAGDEIVIVNQSKQLAMSTTQNNNNRGVAEVTISDNTIETISNSVQVIKLETGSVSNTFAFNVGNGYLYAASSGSNWLRTQSSKDANASFKVEISSDGTASVVAQGSNTRNNLKYNNSANIFSCYASGQEGIAIYKLSSGVGKTYEATDVAIKFNYYIPLDIYNAFIDDYDFAFEYGNEIITDVSTIQAVYNGKTCVKVSFAFEDITDYQKTYSVKPVVVKTLDTATKAYGTQSTEYSVKTLVNYYLNTYSGNDQTIAKYESLLNSIIE